MKITMPTVTVDDEYRRMIACYDGEHGQKASRERVRDWLQAVGESLDDDASDEYARCAICNPDQLDVE